ncbi:TPA: hypothetical protein NBQ01_002176 [Corynebacterium striatum]|nr:hypothetical protein [Corynebacterium striatum]
MNNSEWLEKVTNNASVNAAANRAGIVQRTLSRQVERGEISAENVTAIAIAYGAHPVRALVDTGYLDEKYARTVDPMTALRTVTEDQLADEVLRRMKIGVKTDALTTPADELAARRSNKPAARVDPSDYDDGTVRDFDYDESEYAADSSPDEQKIREERGEDPID